MYDLGWFYAEPLFFENYLIFMIQRYEKNSEGIYANYAEKESF